MSHALLQGCVGIHMGSFPLQDLPRRPPKFFFPDFRLTLSFIENFLFKGDLPFVVSSIETGDIALFALFEEEETSSTFPSSVISMRVSNLEDFFSSSLLLLEVSIIQSNKKGKTEIFNRR